MAAQPDAIQLSHLEQTIYFASQRQGIKLLDAHTVTRLVDVSRKHAVNLLSSMARKGALYRIGRGRYVVIPPDVLYGRKSYVIDPHLIIDELMKADGAADAYYVAYQSAASLHGAAHQLPFALMVALPYQRRPIELGQTQIVFVQLTRSKLFGFREMTYRDVRLNVSDREKTILDCLERFDLCGGVEEVARTVSVLVEEMAADKLLDYLRRMDNQALTQRLGLILDRLSSFETVDEDLLTGIARLVGEYTYVLDPHGPDEGEVDDRWHIRENIDVLRDL
ncbi:MAG: type IV toxin-antitoxin system AbiEi family antitoxin [Chloroflexota bacterium]|nr:type IV toxin-antitoxin system AbiEi family antitoxin [Chloroflexota bacterium]